MTLGQEQLDILKKVQEPETELLKINAVSGSGKTFILQEISKLLNVPKALYIAYNKSIAIEAKKKFGKTVDCRTTHSLAYMYTVKPLRLKVGWFTWRNITERISYMTKIMLIEMLEEFFLSEHISIDEFYANHEYHSDGLLELMKLYSNKMATGKIECTHGFYLKMFHIMLADGKISVPKQDLLMLDEAGDLNPVTLEVFKLIPAVKKILVGDEKQNIYSFNNTINGFKALEGEGVTMRLTKSFRVSTPIAARVESFCKTLLDANMDFKGIDLEIPIKNEAFISRTNGLLIAKMIELNKNNIPYSLTRPAKVIFSMPIALLQAAGNGRVTNSEHKDLEVARREYDAYRAEDRMHNQLGFFQFLLQEFPDDSAMKTSIQLIQQHSPKTIYDAATIAKSHEKTGAPFTLTTAHSSKGLTFDRVEIGEDMNSMISKVLKKPKVDWSNNDYEALRLYYVAVTRTRMQILNAQYIDLEDTF